jgi:hypothetical protein
MKKPTKTELNKIDLSHLEPLLAKQRQDDGYFQRPAGVEHYKLLAWISQQIDGGLITEIGTLDGMGLVALSYNPKNKVVSWDIKDCDWKGQVPENGKRKIVYNGFFDEVVKSDIIFYDGAHDGIQEAQFLTELQNRNWKGYIFFDDIHFNIEMEEFWKAVTLPKKDWTDIGHHCGTGLIILK